MPSVVFPPGVDKKEHLNKLIRDPLGGKSEMRVSYIRAAVDPDYSVLSDDSEEELGHRIGVAAARQSNRGKAKESEASHGTTGVTRILKRGQREQDELPIARQLRSGHYVQEAIKETNEESRTVGSQSQ